MAGVGIFQKVHNKIGETITVDTDKKIQFRDTGVYIQSSADGKLKISADGAGADDITLVGGVTVTGAIAQTGNLVVTGNLTVTGDFAFGNAAADTITMTGDIIWAACSPAYLIDMAAASPSTADLRLSNGTTIVATGADQTTITEPTITLTCATLVSLNGATAVSGANTFSTGTGVTTIKGATTISGVDAANTISFTGTNTAATPCLKFLDDIHMADADGAIGAAAGFVVVDIAGVNFKLRTYAMA